MKKFVDPIVEEVRTIRLEIFKEAGSNLHTLCENLRASQKDHNGKIVSRKPKLISELKGGN